MSKKILVTGGVGFIGSHTCVELIEAGYDLLVYDNLSNSNLEALKRVETITKREIEFVQGDILDGQLLKTIFFQHDFYGVVHFAGLKAVGESVANPLRYYENNVAGTINLLKVMEEYKVKNFVFSSSATVYSDDEISPITENGKRSCASPYGQSKLMVEYILEDLAKSDSRWNLVALRYFNPIGAHSSGLIGEDPNDIPNNLMPYISQVAVGKLEQLNIFGNDYNTPDGTGVRDYIHVVDLAKGHVAAIDYILRESSIGFFSINLGTGKGTSVLELVKAFIKNTKQPVPYIFSQRRLGDIDSYYGDASRAQKLLNWQAELTIEDMCIDTWRWQSGNPEGY